MATASWRRKAAMASWSGQEGFYLGDRFVGTEVQHLAAEAQLCQISDLSVEVLDHSDEGWFGPSGTYRHPQDVLLVTSEPVPDHPDSDVRQGWLVII